MVNVMLPVVVEVRPSAARERRWMVYSVPGARPASVAWVAGAATLASRTAGYGGIW